MNTNLTKPCSECPFRNDGFPYLTYRRAVEIATAVGQNDDHFTCHKTLDKPEREREMCAGSMIISEKEERPNQFMRIMERIGKYDYTKLDMNAPVYKSFKEFKEAHKNS